jgi:hypothetical protein
MSDHVLIGKVVRNNRASHHLMTILFIPLQVNVNKGMFLGKYLTYPFRPCRSAGSMFSGPSSPMLRELESTELDLGRDANTLIVKVDIAGRWSLDFLRLVIG